MMDHLGRPALPERHVQSVKHKLSGKAGGHRPADDPAAEDVEHHRKIKKARPGGKWSKKRFRASPPRTVRAPFSAYGSPFKPGP